MLNIFSTKPTKPKQTKPMVLVIIDGFGIAPSSQGNPIHIAKTPKLDKYKTEYPYGQLLASGESVGLPAGSPGNSEVGHLTIGTGRVVPQSLTRINEAISDGSFATNLAFEKAISYTQKNKSNLHIMGLIGSGDVHSSISHLKALIDLCSSKGLTQVKLHLFTDGRDAPPKDALEVVPPLEQSLKESQVGQVATLMGRYYAMDRDARWERTQRAYDAIVSGVGEKTDSTEHAIKTSYQNGKSDEFIVPTIINNGGKYQGMKDGDAVIYFNFRVDRARQLTMAFTFADFESIDTRKFGLTSHTDKNKIKSGDTFKRSKIIKNLCFVTMTEYQKTFPVDAIAFPPVSAIDSLTEIISRASMPQLHLAESEKERMVTYYFDGMSEERASGEDVKIIPSPNVRTYDKKPEMSLGGIVKYFQKNFDGYKFIVMNFANPDMVAHSGNKKATIKAIEVVDKAVGEIVKTTLAADGTVIITADHGNAEELLTFSRANYFFTTQKGETNTEHSANPVPIHIISKGLKGNQKVLAGKLSDVAPTILTMLGINIPSSMIGRNLLEDQAE